MDIEKIRQIVAEAEKEFLPFIRELETGARDVARDLKENDDWVGDAQTGTVLYRLAAGRRCLDMGAFTGFSSHCMAKAEGSTVDAYDAHFYHARCWEGTPEAKKINQLPSGCGVVGPLKTTHWGICTKKVMSNFFKPRLKHQYDLIFLDASHHTSSVNTDVAFCLRALAPEGVLICHDFRFMLDHDHMIERCYNCSLSWFEDRLAPIPFTATKDYPDRRFHQTLAVAVKS